MGIVTGPVRRGDGRPTAIALIDPKFPHNVGAVQLAGERRMRLPREERMRGYQDVELRHSDHLFDAFDTSAVPVAVELRRNAESLIGFTHPDHAVYVFGPTRHCTNTVVGRAFDEPDHMADAVGVH